MVGDQKVLQRMSPRIVPKREVVLLKAPEEEKGVAQIPLAESPKEKRQPKSPARSVPSPVAAAAATPRSDHDPLLQKSALSKERGNEAFKGREFLKASQQYSMAIRLDHMNHVL